ncbi:acetyl-CoA carboxylase biotin carboxyl carrier protein subunit [Cupriavidus pauculus]|uniref:Acetyl-CoA carboxylase biotin carboxyl carrier protein subunit n=1 Tax=Cupriavidus pauculus TaxID=82633 RepID=A0A2N5C3L7_9BURK|nr:acetyl-CoA carboxylase biotin carboxyl carrier protein subunit [Cupriavidus pauculus]PLP96812.1 acetyl-CoA carboxylase biotin carboxyl carrier protein subunit [Cupriavidus pauculus]
MQEDSNAVPIVAETTGTLWKIVAQPNVELFGDDTILIIESMKMEIPIDAPEPGYVIEYFVNEGDPVEEGQIIGRFSPKT